MWSTHLRRSCAWLCLVALAALSGCSEQYPSLPRLDAADVVLAFGDSLTYGTGARSGESYPEVLSELIGRTVVSEGVPGERTAEGLERLADVLDMHQPRIMLLCLGGNDMLRKVDSSETESNLRQMIDTATARGIGVVLIGVPKPALLGGTAQFYERIAEDYAIPYEGKALNEILKDNDYKSDPIHPNARGYRLLATALAEVLSRSGAI
ncbi:MAG: arylesterase [Betaproteobacteria bacterium]|nr:MAG: arylesterase [Betaproteobacteria bacterium]